MAHPPKGYEIHPLYDNLIGRSMKEQECKNIGNIGNDGISATLAERGNRYGEFHDHAALCQHFKDAVTASPGWLKMTPVERQGLEVILDKIARMCIGDPHYIDNWHDIQGYAKLVENDCIRIQNGGRVIKITSVS